MDAQNYLEHDKKSTTNNDHQENLQQDKLLSTSVNDKHKLSAAPIANNHLNNNNNHTITAREGPKPKTTGHDMIEAKNVPAKVDNLQTTAQVNNCEPIEDNSSSGNIDNNHSGPLDDECQLSAEIERLEQEVKETHQSMIERNAPSTLSPPEDYENLNSGNQLVQLCDEQAGKTKRSIDHEPKVNKKTPAVEVAAPQEPALQPVQSETATIIASMDTNSNNSDSPAISQENSPREQQDNDHPKTTPNFSPESPPNTANSSPFHLSQTQVDQASGATTSTKIIDNNTNIAGDQEKVPDEEVGSALGRNRRVRQKNRYFLDFHCIDLVKGCRSKDDYDAYPSTGAGSATRSSNRRSTTDSSRSGLQEDEPDVFIDRYCRKCSNKTPHDFEDGCQVCLYKQIVLTNKRQKTSSQRSRSSRSQSQRQDTKNNNNEPAATTITTSGSSTTTTNSVSKSSNSRSKRKASKQAGGPSKQSNSIDLEPDISLKRYTDIIDGLELATNTAIVSTGPKGILAGDDNDDKNSSNNNDAASAQVSNKLGKLTATIKVDGNASKSKWVIKPGRSQNDENVISIRREVEHDIKHQEQQQNHHHSYPAEDKSSTTTNQDDEMIHTNNNNNNDNNNKSTNACDIKAINNLNSNKSNINNNNNDNNNSQMSGLELTHLDTWTPDQVAQYVSSKGFVSEAESFRAEAVDGISLLLMQRTDFTYGLKMKLGPALKLYDQVCKLKRDYFRDIATAS